MHSEIKGRRGGWVKWKMGNEGKGKEGQKGASKRLQIQLKIIKI